MALILRCDAPGCAKETPAKPRAAGFETPPGWWAFKSDDRWVIACCTEHSTGAISAAQRLPEEMT